MEVFFNLLILIAIAVQYRSTVANIARGSGDFGDSMSGLGSIATTDTPEQQCTHVPPYVDFSRVQNNITEEERALLIVQGRCYLTCTGLETFEVFGKIVNLIMSMHSYTASLLL